MTVWRQAIGKPKDSTQYAEIRQLLGDPEDVKKYKDGAVYECFYAHGIAIGWLKGKVDSIDFYQHHRLYSNAQHLPGIKPETTGRDIIEKYGEPDEKGGGGGTTEVWLEYDSFQVCIASRDWDAAQQATWNAVTIF